MVFMGWTKMFEFGNGWLACIHASIRCEIYTIPAYHIYCSCEVLSFIVTYCARRLQAFCCLLMAWILLCDRIPGTACYQSASRFCHILKMPVWHVCCGVRVFASLQKFKKICIKWKNYKVQFTRLNKLKLFLVWYFRLEILRHGNLR